MYTISLSLSLCLCQAKPLGGKVERIITWRWREEPVSGEGGEELEDDVIESEGKSPEKRKPQKVCTCATQ